MSSAIDELTSPIDTRMLPGLRDRFVKGVRWNLVASVAAQGSTYLVNILLARLLKQQVFGQYAIIQSTLLTAAMVAQVGTGLTATKYVAEFRSSDKQRAGRILGLCLAVSAVTSGTLALGLLVAAEPIARVMLTDAGLAFSLRLGAGIVFFSGITGSQLGALAGLESYRALARATSIGAALYILFGCLGAVFFGLNGALGGILGAVFGQWLIVSLTVRRELVAQKILVSLNHLAKERAVVVKFAAPAALSGLVSMPALWLANTILVHQPDGFAQMALFSAAATSKTLMLFLPSIINNVGTSLLNNQRGAGAEIRYRKVFWTNLGLASGAALSGALVLAVGAAPLFMLFGKGFVHARPILWILLIGGTLEAVMAAVYQIIQAHERMFFSLLCIAIPRDVLIVVIAWLLIPVYGARGLALAYTLGWLVASFIYVGGAARIGLKP